MQYDPMLPEGPKKRWEDMNAKEAKAFFDWFIAHIPAKMEQLRNLVAGTGSDPSNLDYSDNSLVFIWQWYLNHRELEEIPEAEIRADCDQFARSFIEIMKSRGAVVTDETYQNLYDQQYSNYTSRQRIKPPWGIIATDIGIYLGECLIKKYADRGISWGFFTNWKSDSNVNRPVLTGLEFVRNVFWESEEKPKKLSPFTVDLMQLVYLKVGENFGDNKRNAKTLLDLFRHFEGYLYHINSPQNLAEICEMDEKHASQYFEWFVYQISDHVSHMGMCDLMDYSASSLPLVWERFIIEVTNWEKEEEKKHERLKSGKKNKMPLLKIRVVDGVEVYERVIFRALELSIYFTETFRRHHKSKGIRWGYVPEPKTLPYVNRPVLLGFRDPATPVMDQVSIFSDLAVRVAKGYRNKNTLAELYDVWDKKA